MRLSSVFALLTIVVVVWLFLTVTRAGSTTTEPKATSKTVSTYRGLDAREWAMRYRRRTRQVQSARRVLYARGTVREAIGLACVIYGSCSTLWRRAWCESRYSSTARNASGAAGLFQFLPSTWRSTPFAGFSIFSPYANALAAGWMHASGRGGEWACW